jgi:tetratricopeptide (TPR) repeat protein
VLEGSVRQAGDQLRITAQLIEAGTDTHLWSETYDRKLENIFQIQDEISARVVEELKITLLGETPRSRQINEQAYKMTLQARYFWNRRSEGDADLALNLYQQALELAPEYAPAWAGISVVFRDLADRGGIAKDEGMTLAREAAEKALQLDPELADAHIRMGQLLGLAGDYAGQRKAYETALALEPNNSTALAVMAVRYQLQGKADEAIGLFQKAEAVDPMGALWPSQLVSPYVTVGRYDEAENAARRAYELNGDEQAYRLGQAFVYVIQGRYEDVLDVLDGQTEDWPDGYELADAYLDMAVAYHALGRQEEAEEMANKLDALDDQYETLIFASLFALQGDLDEAFVWLEKAADEFPRHYVEYHPSLKEMRNDPRWEPALEKFESVYETSDQ